MLEAPGTLLAVTLEIPSSRVGRASIGAALLASGGLVAGGLIAAAPGSAAPGPVAHRIHVDPDVHPGGSQTPAGTFRCQSRPMDASQGPRCYQAAQIQNAYNITPLLNRGIDGTGHTIVIVDAYGSPTIEADLHQFDAAMGLPDPHFSQIAPAGEPPAYDANSGNQVGWGVETTLDVEWAHGPRPGRTSPSPSQRATTTPTSSTRPSTSWTTTSAT